MDQQSPIELTSGYVMKPRDLRRHYVGQSPPHVREVYDWLVEQANHTEKMSSGRMIKRGQCFRTYRDIMEGLAWFKGAQKLMYDSQTIETALKVLRRTGLITTSKTTRGMLVTICNYDIYQNPKSYINHTGTDADDRERTTHEPQTSHTINKALNAFEMNEKKQSGAADSLPSLEGESVTPLEIEIPLDTPEPRKKPDLPFPERWNNLLTLMESKEPILHAEICSLKSIEDWDNGNSVFICPGNKIRFIDKSKKDIEEIATAYFGEPISINFEIATEGPR